MYELWYIAQCTGLHAILGSLAALSVALSLTSWTWIMSSLTSPERRIRWCAWLFLLSCSGLAASLSHWIEDMTVNVF